ncbi:MAG: AraC family transcriptional regulator [Lachnospiraceae bacterium]|nr:AraC family transcriptional regulator [Lachnospiraceae bacterium]
MSDKALRLRKEFEIKSIVSLHDFQYKSSYFFRSEYHDYWKLIYVKKGSAVISLSDSKEQSFTLEEGNLFLEAPNEYYSFRADSEEGVTIFTIGFYCASDRILLLKDRVLSSHDSEQGLLSKISSEGGECFAAKPDKDSLYRLERKFHQPYGGEQVVAVLIELLMISLIRQYAASPMEETLPSDQEILKDDTILLNRITDYYEKNITAHLKIEDLCHQFGIGRARLQRIFREQTGYSAIDYFCRMRIRAAQSMIREQQYTLTQTSKTLGYTSIQYFSKQFKKITGMTPSAYQKAINTTDSDPLFEHIEL